MRKLILSKLGAHVKFGISLSSPADFASLINCFRFWIHCRLILAGWIYVFPHLSGLNIPIYARSIFGSGLIPLILASDSYEDLVSTSSPFFFPPQDVRSSWDIATLFKRINPILTVCIMFLKLSILLIPLLLLPAYLVSFPPTYIPLLGL